VPQSCRCGTDCHSCDFTGGVAGTCVRCKNSAVLFNGQCVDETECPSGNVLGTGTFDRICVTSSDESAHVANEDEAAEEFVNEGSFSTVCRGRVSDNGDSCVCGGGCHTCNMTMPAGLATQCSICKNNLYLHSGICTEECPAGFTGEGTGTFGRTCVSAPLRRRRSAMSEVFDIQSTGASGVAGVLVGCATIATVVIAVIAFAKPSILRRRFSSSSDATASDGGPTLLEVEGHIESGPSADSSRKNFAEYV